MFLTTSRLLEYTPSICMANCICVQQCSACPVNQRRAMWLHCADLYRTAIVPIGVAFALVLWMGNAAYLYLSVSFIQMIKALMPLSVRSSTALTAGSTA